MFAQESQVVEEFLHTPYGQQLRQGFRWLRFSSSLEREFRAQLNEQSRLSQFLAGLLLTLVVGGYLYIEQVFIVAYQPVWLTEVTLIRLALIGIGGMVLLISGSRRGRRIATKLYPLLLVVIGGLASHVDLHYEASRLPLVLRYEAGLLIVSSFFFLGITFWTALCCGLLIMLVDGVMAQWRLEGPLLAEHWIATGYYLVLLFIGATGRFVHEFSQREQFLMRKLLGWVAEHDALTGLANRRHYDSSLRVRLSQARRDRMPMALLLADLDDFKVYNDTLGHPAGDELLRVFGVRFAEFARRPLDVAARTGGEEFALLLYDTDEAGAEVIAGNILKSLRENALPHPSEWPRGPLTLSIGVAVANERDTAETLYKRADTALYRAKAGGKNRFVLSWLP